MHFAGVSCRRFVSYRLFLCFGWLDHIKLLVAVYCSLVYLRRRCVLRMWCVINDTTAENICEASIFERNDYSDSLDVIKIVVYLNATN